MGSYVGHLAGLAGAVISTTAEGIWSLEILTRHHAPVSQMLTPGTMPMFTPGTTLAPR